MSCKRINPINKVFLLQNNYSLRRFFFLKYADFISFLKKIYWWRTNNLIPNRSVHTSHHAFFGLMSVVFTSAAKRFCCTVSFSHLIPKSDLSLIPAGGAGCDKHLHVSQDQHLARFVRLAVAFLQIQKTICESEWVRRD